MFQYSTESAVCVIMAVHDRPRHHVYD